MKSQEQSSTSHYEPHHYCGDRALAKELSAHRLSSLGLFVVRPRAANDDDDPAIPAATCEVHICSSSTGGSYQDRGSHGLFNDSSAKITTHRISVPVYPMLSMQLRRPQ